MGGGISVGTALGPVASRGHPPGGVQGCLANICWGRMSCMVQVVTGGTGGTCCVLFVCVRSWCRTAALPTPLALHWSGAPLPHPLVWCGAAQRGFCDGLQLVSGWWVVWAAW
jgi:hypothetical protein